LSLLSRFFGATHRAKRLLADYPDEDFVHIAECGALSRMQREENLTAFLASIPGRVARLRDFAAALDTSLPAPDGVRGQVDAIGLTLDGMCKSRLSGLKQAIPAFHMDWRARAAQPAERRLRTLIIDLGTYCGEVGIRCAPQYRWTTDETFYTPATQMRTSGRVVIGHDPARIPKPMHNHIDAIAIAAFTIGAIVNYRTSKDLWRPNYFDFLADIADGRHV